MSLSPYIANVIKTCRGNNLLKYKKVKHIKREIIRAIPNDLI